MNRHTPVLIGITGGIATGKSTALSLFAAHGADTISADEIARSVLAPGTSTLREVATQFGAGILNSDGSLNRARLASLAFQNASTRAQLDALTHPAILAGLKAEIDRVCGASVGLIAVEVPLLYETGIETWFDAVVVVSASYSEQRERLKLRYGISESDAVQRIGAQLPLDIKAGRADFVLANHGDVKDLEAQVAGVIAELSRGQGAS